MAHEYSNAVAKHYAAFRPALHEVILRRLISPDEYFKTGLDVGCGTGCSTVALADYCDHVFGLDPSQPMLNQATRHPRISYVNGFGDDFSIIEQAQYDVISFAGSLFYSKSNRLKSELTRTLSPDGIVLVYDFQLFLNNLMASIGMNGSVKVSEYNFLENMKEWAEFSSTIVGTDRVQLNFSAQEATHILLANSYRYRAFQKRFQENDPFSCLKEIIKRQHDELHLNSEIYFARYYLS